MKKRLKSSKAKARTPRRRTTRLSPEAELAGRRELSTGEAERDVEAGPTPQVRRSSKAREERAAPQILEPDVKTRASEDFEE